MYPKFSPNVICSVLHSYL